MCTNIIGRNKLGGKHLFLFQKIEESQSWLCLRSAEFFKIGRARQVAGVVFLLFRSN